MSRISSTLLSLALLSSVSPALAEGPMRGFTVGDNIDGESIQDLAGTGANAARFWCRAPVNVTSETEGEFYARIDECLSRFDDDLEDDEAHSIGAVIVLDRPAPIYVSGARVPQQNIFLSAAHRLYSKKAGEE